MDIVAIVILVIALIVFIGGIIVNRIMNKDDK